MRLQAVRCWCSLGLQFFFGVCVCVCVFFLSFFCCVCVCLSVCVFLGGGREGGRAVRIDKFVRVKSGRGMSMMILLLVGA